MHIKQPFISKTRKADHGLRAPCAVKAWTAVPSWPTLSYFSQTKWLVLVNCSVCGVQDKSANTVTGVDNGVVFVF